MTRMDWDAARRRDQQVETSQERRERARRDARPIPPTAAQRRYIELLAKRLGRTVAIPKTRDGASATITQLKLQTQRKTRRLPEQ